MSMRIIPAVLSVSLLLCMSGARAAILNQTFQNDFQTNGIYLWSTDFPSMHFEGFALGTNMQAWQAQLDAPSQLVLRGPTVAAGAGRFDLRMNYKSAPFRLEWAEVFFDKAGTVVRGFGTLAFDGSGWSNSSFASHVIDIPLNPSAAAMPLPGSWLMLTSAVALLCLRKRAMV
ncbi:MAG: hypothetical protein IPM80_06290 [Proteobacteria bacterium]|nr:hypothetical protein [Pseudomonadota bacterium]